jgi:hypothetical protein
VVRYFYDTEFIDDGRTIELISIGVVAEDGREYYAVSTEFNPDDAGPWVRTHVLPKLPSPSSQVWRSRRRIREDLEEFFGIDGPEPVESDVAGPRARRTTLLAEPIELWAWVGAYDHVVLAQLWGPMTGLPREIPRFTREMKQLWEDRGRPALPALPDDNHDALVDARHNRAKFQAILAQTTRADNPRG